MTATALDLTRLDTGPGVYRTLPHHVLPIREAV